jgi:hypothetical protein
LNCITTPTCRTRRKPLSSKTNTQKYCLISTDQFHSFFSLSRLAEIVTSFDRNSRTVFLLSLEDRDGLGAGEREIQAGGRSGEALLRGASRPKVGPAHDVQAGASIRATIGERDPRRRGVGVVRVVRESDRQERTKSRRGAGAISRQGAGAGDSIAGASIQTRRRSMPKDRRSLRLGAWDRSLWVFFLTFAIRSDLTEKQEIGSGFTSDVNCSEEHPASTPSRSENPINNNLQTNH